MKDWRNAEIRPKGMLEIESEEIKSIVLSDLKQRLSKYALGSKGYKKVLNSIRVVSQGFYPVLFPEEV